MKLHEIILQAYQKPKKEFRRRGERGVVYYYSPEQHIFVELTKTAMVRSAAFPATEFHSEDWLFDESLPADLTEGQLEQAWAKTFGQSKLTDTSTGEATTRINRAAEFRQFVTELGASYGK